MPSTEHHTFDKACAQWRDIQNIWTPVGWPDHIQNFNILWNGSVMGMPDLSDRSKKWVGQGVRVTPIPTWPGWVGYETGGWLRDDNSVKQGWEPGPAPVLWSEFVNSSGFVLRSRFFAFLPGGCESRTGEEPLFAWMRLTLEEIMEGNVRDQTVGFNLMVEKPGGVPSMTRGNNLVFDESSRYPRPLRPSGKYNRRTGFQLLERGNRVRIGVAPQQDCSVTYSPPPAKDSDVEWGKRPWHRILIEMKRREGASVDVLIPMVPVEKKTYMAVARNGYDAARQETTAFWRRRTKRPVLTVPEEPINQCHRNSLRFSQTLSERDPKTGDLCKITGSWAYVALWATPGSMDLIMLMDTLGYHEFVESHLDVFCKGQGTSTPPGLDHQWGHCDGTSVGRKGAFVRHPGYLSPPDRYKTTDWLSDNGAILYALSMHGLLTGDRDFIKRRIENIVLACEWIRDARAIEGHPGCPGILPPAVNTDLSVAIQGVYGIAWNYVGLSKAVKLLQRVGHPRAAEFAREQRAFKETFLKAYRHATARAPTWTDSRGRKRRVPPMALLKGAMPEVSDHAFSLDTGALILVFSGLMRASDPVMRDALAWFREGPHAKHLRRESDCWQLPALDHEISSCEPFASFNGFHSLQSGDKPRFLEGLYSLYAGAFSRQTWIGCESRGGMTGQAGHLPVYLSRQALLDDTTRENELHVLRMVPPEWLKSPGLTLDRMPTEHGPVSLKAVLSRSGDRLDIEYKPRFFAPPRKAVLHIPGLPGLKRTRLNGRNVKGPRVTLDVE